jgi:2-haloalkanoic acid dehalogenase type II
MIDTTRSLLHPPIKAVLFDLDDTLWPIEHVIRDAELAMHGWLQINAPRVAVKWSIERLRERRTELMQRNPAFQVDLGALRHAGLREAFVACDADPEGADGAMTIFSNARNAVTPFNDVVPGLTRLKEKFRLGSVSNGSADLKAIGVAHHFETSIAAYRFGRAKPDPAIFHAACDALAVKPSETVYVGDDIDLDVIGAANAGMRTVWINRFGRQLPAHARPDATCTDFLQLERWLNTAHKTV